ncbi:hypothetical protein K435DRAFT_800563 [Dendrothele bispora CBS 962.96]|uniref:Uncharacterized protein n=1 Tax=Dendrothele bispora (strain CBS 962.96) TaxID=1314807 RepID=A0A4S8LS46_DENBC|nr:hypothetical protein K435DRAFT_800563 [Dendrothele bispora CBS 962.96]
MQIMFPILLAGLVGGAAAILSRFHVDVDFDDTRIIKTFLDDPKVAKILSQLSENLEELDEKIVRRILGDKKIQTILSKINMVLEGLNNDRHYIAKQVVESLRQLSNSLEILFITLAIVTAVYGLGSLACKIWEARRPKYFISFITTDSKGKNKTLVIEGSGQVQGLFNNELVEAISSTSGGDKSTNHAFHIAVMFPILFAAGLAGGAATFLSRSRVDVDIDDTRIVKTFLNDAKVAKILAQLSENLKEPEKKIVNSILGDEKIQSVLSNTNTVLEGVNNDGHYIAVQVVESLRLFSNCLAFFFITLSMVITIYVLGPKYSISFITTDSRGENKVLMVEGSGRVQGLLSNGEIGPSQSVASTRPNTSQQL